MRTAAAYIRVSTDDQLEYSPDSQLLQIRRYAKDNGFLLPQQWVFVEEEGRSGRQSSKRPEFLRMIAAAKQSPKPFDAILVWKYSRFARSRQDSIVYKSMLRKELGIDVISVSEYLGDDKMAIITEAIIEAMDEFYSVNLAEEVTRGMAEKARRGQPPQGRPGPGPHPGNAQRIPLPFQARPQLRHTADGCRNVLGAGHVVQKALPLPQGGGDDQPVGLALAGGRGHRTGQLAGPDDDGGAHKGIPSSSTRRSSS